MFTPFIPGSRVDANGRLMPGCSQPNEDPFQPLAWKERRTFFRLIDINNPQAFLPFLLGGDLTCCLTCLWEVSYASFGFFSNSNGVTFFSLLLLKISRQRVLQYIHCNTFRLVRCHLLALYRNITKFDVACNCLSSTARFSIGIYPDTRQLTQSKLEPRLKLLGVAFT